MGDTVELTLLDLRSNYDFSVLYFGHITVQWAGCRPAQDLAVDRKRGCVARADELMRAVIPVVGAPEVGARRVEGDNIVIVCLHQPRGRLFRDLFPAVHTFAVIQHLFRLTDLQLADVADLGKAVLISVLRPDEQISSRRKGYGGGDDGT